MLKVHKAKTGLTKKLHDKYTGRANIKEKGPFDTYKIADFQTNKPVQNFINAQDLRRYYDPQNYWYEPPDDDLFEAESDDDTIIYNQNEAELNEPQVDDPTKQVKL